MWGALPLLILAAVKVGLWRKGSPFHWASNFLELNSTGPCCLLPVVALNHVSVKGRPALCEQQSSTGHDHKDTPIFLVLRVKAQGFDIIVLESFTM